MTNGSLFVIAVLLSPAVAVLGFYGGLNPHELIRWLFVLVGAWHVSQWLTRNTSNLVWWLCFIVLGVSSAVWG